VENRRPGFQGRTRGTNKAASQPNKPISQLTTILGPGTGTRLPYRSTPPELSLPGVGTPEGVLAVLQEYLNSSRNKSAGVLEVYSANLNPKLRPQIRMNRTYKEYFLEIEIPRSEWEALYEIPARLAKPLGLSRVFQHRKVTDHPVFRWLRVQELLDPTIKDDIIVLHATLRDLKEFFWSIRELKALKRLGASFYACGQKTEIEIAKLLRDEDCQFIGCPRWPLEVVNAFGISGSTRRVTIC